MARELSQVQTDYVKTPTPQPGTLAYTGMVLRRQSPSFMGEASLLNYPCFFFNINRAAGGVRPG